MQKQVFHYRRFQNLVLPVFLCVWGGMWTYGGLSNPDVSVNGQLVNGDEKVPYLRFALVLGFSALAIAAAVLMFLWNARIEVEDGKVSSFDLFGRRKLTANLSESKLVVPTFKLKSTIIETPTGRISVWNGLNNLGLLTSLVTGAIDPWQQVRFRSSK